MKPANVYNYILFCHGVYLGKSLIEASSSASHEKTSNNLAENEKSKLSGNVNKSCAHSPEDCVFRLDHLLSYHEVYLDCINWQCTCRTSKDQPEEFRWDLKWNGKDCLISEFGPCGANSGLDVGCQEDLLCIQSRCRSPRHFHKGLQGDICFDNVDCEKKLICKLEHYSRGRKTCEFHSGSVSVSNQNPHLELEQPLPTLIRYKPNPNAKSKSESNRRLIDAGESQPQSDIPSNVATDVEGSTIPMRSYYKDREISDRVKVLPILKINKQNETSEACNCLFEIKLVILTIFWVST